MMYLAASILSYAAWATVHLLLHRLLAKKNIFSFKTTLVFIIGFFVLVVFMTKLPVGEFSIPVASGMLYAALAGFHAIIYTSPLLGDMSPSTRLMIALGKKEKWSKDELVALFSDRDLIGGRLRDLLKWKVVKEERGKLCLLPKGEKILEGLKMYRAMLGWRSGG